jgi:hypothetical protein
MHFCWENIVKFYKIHGTYSNTILVSNICLMMLGLVGVPDSITAECVYLVL